MGVDTFKTILRTETPNAIKKKLYFVYMKYN